MEEDLQSYSNASGGLMGGTRKIPHFLSQKKGDALISDLHRFSDSVEPSVCDFMFHVFDALEFQISLHAFCCVLFTMFAKT
jgi:hypothetical protein